MNAMRPPPPMGVPATGGDAVGGSGVGVPVGRGDGVAVGGSGVCVALGSGDRITVGAGTVVAIVRATVRTGVPVAGGAVNLAKRPPAMPSTITPTTTIAPPMAAGSTHPGNPEGLGLAAGVVGGAGTVSAAPRARVAWGTN